MNYCYLDFRPIHFFCLLILLSASCTTKPVENVDQEDEHAGQTELKKGQLLAIVENPDFIQFQQDYLENLAEQEFLKAEYERQEELYSKEVIAQKDFQRAKSAFDINKVRVKTMGDKLELIGFDLTNVKNGKASSSVKIFSPISGSVREIYSNVGKFIEPQTTIMDLTDNTDLHVELSVFENDIPLIQIGQKIRFSAANSIKVREAEIFLIGSGVRSDRSVTVHGHLSEIDDDLLPGMYVSANIVIGSEKAWTIPEDAVVRFQGKNFVYLLDSKKQEDGQSVFHFEMKEVITGTTEDGYLEIAYTTSQNDISSDEIVLKGAFTILSQEKNSDDGGHGH